MILAAGTAGSGMVTPGSGMVDVSRPYKVDDVAKERPYLTTNQATGMAFSGPGNAGSYHFPASGVVAARQALDSLAGIIANRPQKAQAVEPGNWAARPCAYARVQSVFWRSIASAPYIQKITTDG